MGYYNCYTLVKLVSNFQALPTVIILPKPIDFLISFDEINIDDYNKNIKFHNYPINIEFWRFLKLPPKSRVVNKDFELQKMFRVVLRRSRS